MGDEGTESDLAEQSEPFPAKPSGRKADYTDIKWNIDLCRDRHRKVVTYRN